MAFRVSLVTSLALWIAVTALAGPAELNSQAKAALAASNDSLAAALFDRVMTDFPLSPEAPEATLRRAYLRIRLGEPQPEELFARVVSAYPTSSQAGNAMRRLAYFDQRAGRLEAAQQLFLQASSNNNLAPTERAECLVHYAFLDTSKYFAAGLPDRPSGNGSSQIPADRKDEAATRLAAARAKFTQVVQTYGGSRSTAKYAALAQAGIGETYVLEQSWTEAGEAYAAGLRYEGLPKSAQALLHLGRSISRWRLCMPSETRVEVDEALRYASFPPDFPGSGISLNQIKAEAACMKAPMLHAAGDSEQALDLLSSTLSHLTKSGIPTGEDADWVARVAGWKCVILHQEGRYIERDEAVRYVLASFANTKTGATIQEWVDKLGWGVK